MPRFRRQRRTEESFVTRPNSTNVDSLFRKDQTTGRSQLNHHTPKQQQQQQIFYASEDDDDETPNSSKPKKTSNKKTRVFEETITDDEATADDDDAATPTSTPAIIIQRYRGFSTSIKSLFLDESIVCGSTGCFGMMLSARTEYLLQLRNERRGALSPRSFRNQRKMPSRIISLGLLLTILLICSTFLIWGFGSQEDDGSASASATYDSYYDDTTDDDVVATNDDAQQQQQYWDDYLANNADQYNNYNKDNYYYNNDDYGNDDNYNDDDAQRKLVSNTAVRRHPIVGIFKLRDYHEGLWKPLYETISYEWTRKDYPNRSVAEEDAISWHRFRFRSDLASNIRLSLGIAFLLFLGILGRRRRMRTRFHLVRARAQEDHLYYASSNGASARRVAFDDTREDQYEGACSHTLCGCYPSDEVEPDEEEEDHNQANVEVADSGVYKRKRKRLHEDIVARTFSCLMATCCGFLCKCWCQCLSICALAQEAREVRLLIPPRYQRIDYITHQPFHEYQEAVNDLRRGWLGKARRMSGIAPHWNALSRLSRYILVLSILVVTAIVGALVFNPRAEFHWADAVLLIATFFQAFLVLFIVHGIFHKSDLSLDAVIKFFASGFLIATPTAFVFEGLLANSGLMASYAVYDFFFLIFEDAFKDWLAGHIRIYWLIGELFNAYIVAAVTEELCKYYSFRAIEHPDLVFLTGLQREDDDTTNMIDGGIVKYPFGSHQVQELAKQNSFNDDASRTSGQSSKGSHRSSSHRSSKSKNQALIEKTGTTEQEFEEDENDARTRRQRAMAITTGMIGVAVGLACAENFLYVFVLGGSASQFDDDGEDDGGVIQAWMVLLFRSIFPVHALAAAMQSINMIRKFVELDNHDGHRVGVGRIILPAVLLHGTFDAILMGVNVYVEAAWENYLEENNGNINEDDGPPYNALLVNFIAWASVVSVTGLSVYWYYRENRSQRTRLIVLEEQDKTLQTEDWNPAVSGEQPAEVV